MQTLFPCASAVCKNTSEVSYRVITTFYPHGKDKPRAWVNIELLCQDCVDKLRKSMKENSFIEQYNDIKIETL